MAFIKDASYRISYISNNESLYLTDPGAIGDVKLKVDDSGNSNQVWQISELSKPTLSTAGSTEKLYLEGDASDGGSVKCTSDSSKASKWTLTEDAGGTIVELLGTDGNSLSPQYYLVQSTDDKTKAIMSKTKQKWTFIQKVSGGNVRAV